MANHKEWKEGHLRSFIKALSWRFFATLTTIIISFMITGNAKFAITIGSIEVFAKIFLFYLHERLWANLFRFGVKGKQKVVLTP